LVKTNVEYNLRQKLNYNIITALLAKRPRLCKETWKGREFGATSVPPTILSSGIIWNFPLSNTLSGRRGNTDRVLGFAVIFLSHKR
jgi:hypothetical protein